MKHLPKVFVVDYDSAVLHAIETLLNGQGYQVSCFESAEQFIAHHHPTQVGCVLIDLLMPGVDGRALLRRLQESRSVLSVVIISGLVDSPSYEQFGQGPAPILSKAYEITTLLTMVEDAVAGSIKRRAEQLQSTRKA